MQPKLTESERILLIACLQIQNTQRRILEALEQPASSQPEQDIPAPQAIADAIEILEYGAECFYDHALGRLNVQLSDLGAIPLDECNKILHVLRMHQMLEDYVKNNPDDEEVVQSHRVRFRGFDGNHESRWRWFAEFAVTRMGYCPSLERKGKESKDFNSHWPMMDQYERMTKVWLEWKKTTETEELTRENVLAILKAAE